MRKIVKERPLEKLANVGIYTCIVVSSLCIGYGFYDKLKNPEEPLPIQIERPIVDQAYNGKPGILIVPEVYYDPNTGMPEE